jgi:AmmeMemoRadiSam system protein B
MLTKSVSTKKAVLTVFVLAAGLAAVFFYLRFTGQHRQLETNAVHYSYFSQKDFYEEAYQAAKKQAMGPHYAGDAKAIIVNHHLLAASFIAETFNSVATMAPLTVLLISPNHFDAGKADVITSVEDWQTPYGVLSADRQLINQLTTGGLANVEESPFDQEHGVTGIVAFIKRSLPNAKVVPLIFNNRMTLREVLALADKYYQALPNSVLIDGSFDFSHYLPSSAADFHDLDSLAAATDFDFSKIYRLDMNSRPGLAFFLELLKDGGDQNFTLLENSNSAKLVRRDILETTSYIDGYFTQGDAASSSTNTALVLPLIASSAKVADSLNRNSKNWSVEYLERLFFGQDRTIVYVDGDKNALLPELNRYDFTDVLNESQQVPVEKQSIQILSSPNQARAEQAINHGAAAAIQYHAASDGISFYKNKPIIDLKNDFLSDDILKIGGTSLAYGLAWKDNHLTITLLPIGVKNGNALLLIGNESDRVLADTAAHSAVSEKIKQEIKQGIIIIQN